MAGTARRCGPGLLLLLVGACTGAGEPEPPAVEPPAPADTVPAQPSAAVAPVVYVEGAFPHRAHVQVACATCHVALTGHATHPGESCDACHVPPDGTAGAGPAPAECSACHHPRERALPCAHCHPSAPAARAVATPFRIADRAAVERPVTFDHAPHDALACATCHGEGVPLAVPRACAACHDDHHVASSDCSACHAPFPLDAHATAAHRGCAGAGCHAATPATATPGPRNVCLVCHRDQADHEPGGDCRSCHLVTGTVP